jgi:hypothetical protein
MEITIGFGWWLIPAVITLLSFGISAFMSRDLGNDRFGAGAVIALGFYLMAAVVSLLAWLIWALLA